MWNRSRADDSLPCPHAQPCAGVRGGCSIARCFVSVEIGTCFYDASGRFRCLFRLCRFSSSLYVWAFSCVLRSSVDYLFSPCDPFPRRSLGRAFFLSTIIVALFFRLCDAPWCRRKEARCARNKLMPSRAPICSYVEEETLGRPPDRCAGNGWSWSVLHRSVGIHRQQQPLDYSARWRERSRYQSNRRNLADTTPIKGRNHKNGTPHCRECAGHVLEAGSSAKTPLI